MCFCKYVLSFYIALGLEYIGLLFIGYFGYGLFIFSFIILLFCGAGLVS